MRLHLELSARHNPRIPLSSNCSEFTHRKSPGKRERLWLNAIEVLKLHRSRRGEGGQKETTPGAVSTAVTAA